MAEVLERLKEGLAGRYTVRQEVGRGGMATVYLADDVKHGRPVAIKVLRPELAATLGGDRFLREIRVTAGLSHPHILPLLDSGDADGLLYYVMPFVEGETLRDRLNREPQLALAEALRLTSEIADALGSAHRHDVVHRDIKPENILLEEGHAVVGDFGIARAMSAAGGDQLTETGSSIGTPTYMSPEQMDGASHIDGRTDTYSLACVLYEMLVGEPPFTGPTVSAMLARKAGGKVPSLRTVRRDVPEVIERAVTKALSKVPAERHATTPEFAHALKAGAVGGNKKAKMAMAVGVAIGGATIALLSVTGILPGSIRPAAAGFFNESDAVVVSDFENETDQPALGLAIREAVVTDLEQSQYINVIERSEVDRVLERMRLPDTTVVDADVAQEIARRAGHPAVVVGGITPLGAGYQLSIRIVEATTGEVAVRLRETAANDAEVLEAVERLAHLTRRHLGESLRSVRRSQPLPEVTTPSLEALQLFARATHHSHRAAYDSAIPLAQLAIQIDTAFGAAHRALSIWYTNMGAPVEAQAHVDLAHRHSERLVLRQRYLVGATYNSFRARLDSSAYYYGLILDRDPNDVTALNNMGDLYERMGRYEDALPLYRRASELGGSAVGYLNLASAARTLGMQATADTALTYMLENFQGVFVTWQAQALNAFYAGDEDRFLQIARDMVGHRPYPFPPLYGRWLLSHDRAKHGQINAAVALADSAAELAAPAEVPPWRYIPLLTAQYAALAAGDPARVVPLLDKAPRFETLGRAPQFEYRMLGFLANGYALAGDENEALQILARMDSLADAVNMRKLGIGASVRAVLAMNANRPEESLKLIGDAQTVEFGMLHNSTRLLLARVLMELGRFAEAGAHYDSLTSTYRLNVNDVSVHGAILPLAHEGAAGAYLALGDTATAVSHLSRFVDLWQDADSELQSMVADARTRLAGLTGETSGRN